VLPLGGYLAERGELNPLWVVVAATAGSLAGAWVLYGLGASLGERRATTLLARLPLVDEADVARAAGWFQRRGAWAVLVGRLVPGVRSLVSLPAGAARMHFGLFSVLTLVGSAAWSGALVGAGMALGTQWRLVEEHGWVLDAVLVTLVVAAVSALAVRRLRRARG
jgi:membrane protein DedA with SNARE-associated domain